MSGHHLSAGTARTSGWALGIALALYVAPVAAEPLRDPMADPDAVNHAGAKGPSTAAVLSDPESPGFSLVRGPDGRWRVLHDGRLASIGDPLGGGRLIRIDESGLSVRTPDGVTLLRPHGGVTRQWQPVPGNPQKPAAVRLPGQPPVGTPVPLRSPAP